jgi:DNA-binding response OmpR family regulator
MENTGKILIVDDEQINLDFFDVMLSKLGFAVDKAADGEQALERVRSSAPDLVILDNIMPKLSGWEVTKTLKTDPEYAAFKSIPIIMFSAMDDVKDKIEGFELGIEDYITKPFNFSEVLARIKAVLRNRDLSAQVVQRERRIALFESLNRSLIYFTEHLREPVENLLKESTKLDASDKEAVEVFRSHVRTETENTLAALEGLADEIAELHRRGDEMKDAELTLEHLEEKYEKRFRELHRNENIDGVRG